MLLKWVNRFCKEITITDNQILYLINTWSDKSVKGIVVNRVLSSLHGGSIEITLTVFLKELILSENKSPILRIRNATSLNT